MGYVIPDFETRSAINLKKVGAYVYANHPTTEIICLGYSLDGTEPQLWRPGDPVPADLTMAIRGGATLIPHNAPFEVSIWEAILGPTYGFPVPKPDQWYDTMATCARKCLPLDLKKSAAVMQLDFQKAEAPRKYFSPAKNGEYILDGINQVYDYNLQDIRTQNALYKAIGSTTPEELAVWRLDQEINKRGVRLDLPYIKACKAVVDKATVPLVAEFRDLTDGINPTQRDKVMAWIKAQGVDLPDMKKETVDGLLGAEDETDDLGDDGSLAGDIPEFEDAAIRLPDNIRRALEIRRQVNSSSVKKLAKMVDCVGDDGRARYLLQYHGAGTGRWAGRLFQPQNFPRGETAIKPAELVEAIMSGDPDWVRIVAGVEPIRAIASGLRHAIIPSEGYLLMAGDFATIEARIDLALAGQEDKVRLLRDGGLFYETMAETIFDVPAEEIKKGAKSNPPDPIMQEYRQIGKNSALGCGFQMGAKKFRLKYAKDKSEEFCQNVVRTYREEFAPMVPKLWYGLERAALDTAKSGRAHEAYGVRFQIKAPWLTARLPSGRELFYFRPRITHKAMPWDENDIRLAWSYWTRKGGRFVPVDAYGGLLTENVVQALARDLMVASMFKARQEGLSLLLTVHDELVCEVEKTSRQADPKLLEQLMTDAPLWAREIGIPVAAECWIGERYKK